MVLRLPSPIKIPRRLGCAVIAAALVILISACGSATTTPTATPTPTPVLQELRLNLGGEPGSLDPHQAALATDLSVIRQLFHGLLGFKPDLSLEPVVATRVPSLENGGISEDGLSYTFTIREDATWSDGLKVTAGDFVYSIKRLLDPSVAGPSAFLYMIIRGGGEYLSAKGGDPSTMQLLRDAVAVEALDDHTLHITLSEPNPTFLQKMALAPAFPVRQDIVEEFSDGWTESGNLIGNGPYILTQWVHQSRIVLEANPEYWGPEPGLTKISLSMITDVNAELAAYQAGKLDMSQVPPGTETVILGDASLGKEVIRSTDLRTFGLFFNTSQAPFDNLLVRKAFTTAIDRNAWISKVKNGVGRPATGWLPPGMPGHEPDLGSQYTFDQERAAQLLADAGYPGGEGLPSVSLTYVEAGDQHIMAEFLQAQMKDNLGVDMPLSPLDSFQQVVGARQFQVVLVSPGADYPDPEGALASLFVTGAPVNITQYSNPEFDRLAGLAASELDQEERLDLWKRAHRIIVEEAPVGFFFYGERFFLKKPRVQGLTLTGLDGAIPGDTRLAEVFITH